MLQNMSVVLAPPPLLPPASHLTERKIASGLRFKCGATQTRSRLHFRVPNQKEGRGGGGGGWGCDASKGIMHATRSEGAGNTNHFTHLTHLLLRQDTKNTYQANRAFMQGITIHEARSEGLRRGGGAAYMPPASMPALCYC